MATGMHHSYVPLTCHGHSRPVPHVSFSPLESDGAYYMISACKDGNPMLRDGQTGDWIGTFLGHKGAVWQARLSPDSYHAATASADFTAKIWDTHTGEVLYTIQHEHIVRSVSYSPDNSDLIATGGMEKKLRIFDISEATRHASAFDVLRAAAAKVAGEADGNNVNNGNPVNGNNTDNNKKGATIEASAGFEIAEGVHQAPIKYVVWTKHPETVVTASDKTLRWIDIPSRSVIREEVLDGEIKSCELVSLPAQHTSPTDVGGGSAVLAVAAGKCVYFWAGVKAMDEIKRVTMGYTVASVGLDLKTGKIVVGEDPGTWARVYRWEDDGSGDEVEIHKGHHGPIWSIAFSPDRQLYATASEDGTIKMWKNGDGDYGLWRVPEAVGGVTGAGNGSTVASAPKPADGKAGSDE